MSGPFGSSQWMYASGGFYPYEIDQSVRFNDNDSAYLYRTPASAGNRKTWTCSFWFKRANLTGSSMWLLGTTVSDASELNLYINGSNLIGVSNQTTTLAQGAGALRDTAAFYNVVFRFDSTQAAAADRLKIYLNGEEVSYATDNRSSITQNADFGINNTVVHNLGRRNNSSGYFDGYMAEVNLIDGTALDASSFGETKAGIWIPKDYTGSYGTNGFKLAFQDSASLGDDTSGNGHDFTSSGLASTDQMLDSPTSNFPTMNKLWQSKGTWTTAEGNLQNTWGANNYQSGVATMGLPATGKWYWEIYLKSRTYTNWLYWNLVIADYAEGSGNNGNSAAQWSNHYFSMSAERSDTGYLVVSSGSTNSIASSGIYDTGNVIQVAFDADNKRLYLGDSGTWFLSADPGAESGDGTAVWYGWSDDAQGKLFPALNVNYFTYVDVFNFGQDSTFAGNLASGGNADANGIGDFKYSVPSGYLALCAANLPAPGIDPAADEAPTDYFNTVLYTGTGSAGNSITGVGFQPDLNWIKNRNSTGNHLIGDVVRGSGRSLFSNLTEAESTGRYITSLDSDGFTVGTPVDDCNESGLTYVAWNWKAGGTAVSNTDGSITSSVSTSPESGFSIVTYTGTGATSSGVTIGHGLGATPEMIIGKRRNSSDNWSTWHKDLGGNYGVWLNLTNARNAGMWDGYTNFSSTVFSPPDLTYGNVSGATYVNYLFTSIEGFSKAGSYTGNGSTDGAFIYTGFRPAFILIKRTDNFGDWIIIDNKRIGYNPEGYLLEPNSTDAEYSTDPNYKTDLLSNGFKYRNTAGRLNGSGASFVYIAFAEQPFKYANAR